MGCAQSDQAGAAWAANGVPSNGINGLPPAKVICNYVLVD